MCIRDRLKKEFMNKANIKLGSKKILLSVGRLIERKGFHWFVDEVIPPLIEDYKDFIYVIAGAGPMQKYIEDIIHKKNLYNWVILLGKIDDELLGLLYNISDIFIMPNIPVEGDIEGFGVVALEASSCKLPVIASNLEGIRDALLDGEIGDLILPLDPLNFSKAILNLLESDNLRKKIGEKARELVLDNFVSVSYTHLTLPTN